MNPVYIKIDKNSGNFTVINKIPKNIMDKMASDYSRIFKGKKYTYVKDYQINFNTLKDLSIGNGLNISDHAKDSLFDLLSKGCQQKTKARLRSILKYSLSCVAHYGILNRLLYHADSDSFSYCAGQSYTDEIITVREIFLGKI